MGTVLAGAATSPASSHSIQSPGGTAISTSHAPVLEALAPLVLPASSMTTETLARTLQRFAAWADDFEPVAELDHRYLSTDEIPYGPPDPRPLWRAQLEALETEAQKRHLQSFTALTVELQREMTSRAIDRAVSREPGTGLPRPEHAGHVAVALMAWFFRSSDANDLCYGKRIGRHECRGMRGVELEPRPLPTA